MFILEPTPVAQGLARKKGDVCEYPDGRLESQHEGEVLPYRVFDKMRRVNQAPVVDNKHLDAFPRFELVDAVDANGDKNGDLLFRRITDISSSFVLYEVIGTRVEELISVPEPKETAAGS